MLERDGLPRNTRKHWGVMDMFTSWFAEMVSWVYMFSFFRSCQIISQSGFHFHVIFHLQFLKIPATKGKG